MKQTKRFLFNATIMMSTSLLLSSIGVWFNLYLSERLGAVGMGVFQLMSSVYTLAITFACSGIGLASTRMVAEEAVRQNGSIRGAMRRCLLYSGVFGLAAAAALWGSAGWIGLKWLGAAETIRPLRMMAVSMPFISCSSALNGYFTAVRHVSKGAAAQILEQLLKVLLAIYALELLVPDGLEAACFAITAAGVVAEGISGLLAYLLYLWDSRKSTAGNCQHLTRKLVGIALPVAFSSYLRQGLSTIKHLLVPIRLQVGGLSAPAAIAVFGMVQGVALPVILFPYAFFNAFNCLVVPELAQAHSRQRDVSDAVEQMLSMTLSCSMIVCGVLFYFSQEMGALVSHHPDIAIYIRLLAPVVPVMYLDTAVDSMLKGLDEQLSVMQYNIIDALSSLAAVWLLLPFWGIKGYVLIICISEVLNFSLSIGKLSQVSRFRLDLTHQLVRPFLCAAIAVVTSGLLRLWLSAGAQTMGILLMGVSGCIYILLLRLTR
ncbi:MAG: oligosaccharide flippase family protein [Anaerotruncus sp.]|nr:oligosaccharide flippase family protein [Anaerotruncus sp.]